MEQQKEKAPSPELIFNVMHGYVESAVFKGAVELDFFTAIAEGNSTVEALAKRCNASERGIRILADYLTVLGFITKNGGKYSLTPDSALFLDKNKPSYLGHAVHFLMAPEMRSAFDDVAATVRKGGTTTAREGTVTPDNPIWVEFARGMVPMVMPAAQAIPEIIGASSAPHCKVLDIAAGHGIFGVMIAARNPNAEIVALDWPAVLNVAQENAQKFGVANRWKKQPGDAFSVDFGSGYDVVLVTNFLHHFDPPTNEKFLKKVHAALKPGGRAVTLEFVPNEDRVSPPVAAKFSMTMLGGTPSGDAYTFPELDRMFKNAGFSRSERHDLPGHPETIIVSQA